MRRGFDSLLAHLILPPYNYTKKSSFLEIAFSSTWSGHCPFTAEKGVRVPQGSLLNGVFAPKRFLEIFYSLFLIILVKK
jgi:hypothetical protein